MKYLIVVDMQNDFITGPLGNPECVQAYENLKADISKLAEGKSVIFTKDTHHSNYLTETIEGKNLPIEHCQYGTQGWNIADGLYKETFDYPPYLIESDVENGVVLKNTFGATDLIDYLKALANHPICSCTGYGTEELEEFVVVGVCTDICVIANTLLLKAYYPDVPIRVIEKYCAGTSPESHTRALEAMKMCHIEVI